MSGRARRAAAVFAASPGAVLSHHSVASIVAVGRWARTWVTALRSTSSAPPSPAGSFPSDGLTVPVVGSCRTDSASVTRTVFPARVMSIPSPSFAFVFLR
ncbi:hypothetical protein SCALM49S_02164 [Streptomyces californicus]